MTKSDLRTGMLVTFRNGKKMCVYLNVDTSLCKSQNVLTDGVTWMDFDYVNDDLTNLSSSYFDIMEIEVPIIATDIPYHNGTKSIWQRQKPKKMTVAEVEKILGYKVEIISEK